MLALPLAGAGTLAAPEPVALAADTPGAAGSLVLRRRDCRGHKRGLVLAKKHGTKSGTGRRAGGALS